jgi:hypothetical protein
MPTLLFQLQGPSQAIFDSRHLGNIQPTQPAGKPLLGSRSNLINDRNAHSTTTGHGNGQM